MNKSGIYKITCLNNGKFYIGQTVNFINRKARHLAELRGNKHENQHLQNCFNKYGEDSLVFELIIECSTNLLDILEQNILDYWYGFSVCLNKNPIASKPPALWGNKHTLGRKMIEEEKKRLSDYNKSIGRVPPVGAHKGFLHSEETKKKMSEAKLGKKRPETSGENHWRRKKSNV